MSRHKNTWLFILFSKYTYRSSCASSSVLSILQMLTSILQILTHFATCIRNSAKYGQWLRAEEATCGAGDTGVPVSIPGSRRSPGGREGDPLQWDSWRIPRTEELGHNWAAKHSMVKLQAQAWPLGASVSEFLRHITSRTHKRGTGILRNSQNLKLFFKYLIYFSNSLLCIF